MHKLLVRSRCQLRIDDVYAWQPSLALQPAKLCCAAMQRGYGIITSPVRQSCRRIRKYMLQGMLAVARR
jgi:hypothetical protein